MMLDFPYTYGEDAESRPFGEGLTSQIIRSGQPLLINEDLDASRANWVSSRLDAAPLRILACPYPPAAR